jgi:hypothetical protein
LALRKNLDLGSRQPEIWIEENPRGGRLSWQPGRSTRCAVKELPQMIRPVSLRQRVAFSKSFRVS